MIINRQVGRTKQAHDGCEIAEGGGWFLECKSPGCRHETMENAWTGQTSTTLIDNRLEVMPMPRIGWYVPDQYLFGMAQAMTSSNGLLFAAPTALAQ